MNKEDTQQKKRPLFLSKKLYFLKHACYNQGSFAFERKKLWELFLGK